MAWPRERRGEAAERVALKRVVGLERDAARRLARDVETLLRAQVPHVVAYLAASVTDVQLTLVLEFAVGGDRAALVRAHSRCALTPRNVATLARARCCAALRRCTRG